jgi:hypothetical protein
MFQRRRLATVFSDTTVNIRDLREVPYVYPPRVNYFGVAIS